MSRVTEFPDDEPRSRREERGDDGGDDGGEGRSISMPRFGGRLGRFSHDIKLEMRKTTWPTRNEVWSTTVVVMIAVFFFGFYLWGVDWLVPQGFESLQKAFA